MWVKNFEIWKKNTPKTGIDIDWEGKSRTTQFKIEKKPEPEINLHDSRGSLDEETGKLIISNTDELGASGGRYDRVGSEQALLRSAGNLIVSNTDERSEERRVGKECSS